MPKVWLFIFTILTEKYPRSIKATETANPITRVMISTLESEVPSRKANITKLTCN